MNTVRYRYADGEFIIAQFCSGRDGRVRLVFEGTEDGTLLLGDHTAEIREGEVTLPLSKIGDGEIIPILASKGKKISAEGFVISGNLITPIPFSSEKSRKMLFKVQELERRITQLEKACEQIENKITHSTIF